MTGTEDYVRRHLVDRKGIHRVKEVAGGRDRGADSNTKHICWSLK